MGQRFFMWHASQFASGLLVDLYHVDSAYIAWRAGLNAPATFDLYTRHVPFGGEFLLAAGLEPALAFATAFRFGADDIAYLRTVRPYDETFLDQLRQFRFSGEILAIPEG